MIKNHTVILKQTIFFSSLDAECLEPSLHYIKIQRGCHKTLTFILGIKKVAMTKVN